MTKAKKRKAEVFKVSSAYTKLKAAQTLQDEIAAARADLAGSLLALASPQSYGCKGQPGICACA